MGLTALPYGCVRYSAITEGYNRGSAFYFAYWNLSGSAAHRPARLPAPIDAPAPARCRVTNTSGNLGNVVNGVPLGCVIHPMNEPQQTALPHCEEAVYQLV